MQIRNNWNRIATINLIRKSKRMATMSSLADVEEAVVVELVSNNRRMILTTIRLMAQANIVPNPPLGTHNHNHLNIKFIMIF